jgi:hypothetical protein
VHREPAAAAAGRGPAGQGGAPGAHGGVRGVAVAVGCGRVANTCTVARGVAVVDWQWRVWIEGTSAVILSGRSAVVGAVAVAGGRVAQWQWLWQGGKYTHSGVRSGSG